ncbi:MAG: TIGR01212 family radical SAM protein [Nitrospinae bacterium]|nr:TIGR01212 family radical SAM protein [Nitrospinota bacterium]MBI3814116.1 TIGR01212 family radical SAM protein [Nitrospinota bacterium]
MNEIAKRYYPFGHHLREVFGEKVCKIVIDAGFNCPNRDGKVGTGGCIYCSGGSYYLPDFYKNLSVREQLISSIANIKNRFHVNKFIAYFQAYSNTYAAADKLKKIYDEALSVDGIVGLSVGTRPDCLSNNILALLERYTESTYLWLEIGLQSSHAKTLKFINRGHTFEQFANAVGRAKNRGFKICTHVILGLPGETYKDMMETAKKIGKMGIDGVKLHHLQVLKNTPLEKICRRKKINLLDETRYVKLVCDFLEYLPDNIMIQRMVGDAPKDRLIAPLWSLNKTDIIKAIDAEMEKREAYQGARTKKKNF